MLREGRVSRGAIAWKQAVGVSGPPSAPRETDREGRNIDTAAPRDMCFHRGGNLQSQNRNLAAAVAVVAQRASRVSGRIEWKPDKGQLRGRLASRSPLSGRSWAPGANIEPGGQAKDPWLISMHPRIIVDIHDKTDPIDQPKSIAIPKQ